MNSSDIQFIAPWAGLALGGLVGFPYLAIYLGWPVWAIVVSCAAWLFLVAFAFLVRMSGWQGG